ncbi:D-alanyl-D-alanine carboxypeptidase/D-alanyl-D-alanine endopeptidase [Streptomyces sp. YIM S03343]
MVVPELRPWRAAGPHVVRAANAVRPRLARAADAVRPHVARAGAALRPRVARLVQGVQGFQGVKPQLARITRPASVGTWQYTAGAAAAGLVLATGAVFAAGPWDATGQRTAERDWADARSRTGGTDHGRSSGTTTAAPRPAPSAASVLTGLRGATAGLRSVPGEKALSDVLGPLLADGSLGTARGAVVVDVVTGKRLYGAGADDALTPASTTKIATAVAALSAMGTDHRLTTRTALEPGGKELVLVGGGDPTLTARKDAEGWASLRTLADRTAAALKKRGIKEIGLSYDISLYTGPALHPIGVNGNLAPVSALTADEGRTDDSDSGPAARVADPAADAAARFAGFLAADGIRTTSSSAPQSAEAGAKATTVATVTSPPLSALVERMLTNSDNDIAEALARQTAVATGGQASFSGGAAAIKAQLRKLGLPLAGARFNDGSGLNREDKLTADLLTALLVKAGDSAHPELRPVLTGLPVAGFTGTLTGRYTDVSGAAGIVRAKTGTLTGVNTLAGTVVDQDGRLLAFAFLASGTSSPTEAMSALDRTATALAGCGCR